MKLTDIFNTDGEKFNAADRIVELAKVVAKAREAYGNTETVIVVDQMNTTEGLQDMGMLSDNDKFAIAASEFRNIKKVATEFTNSFEGAILDKKVEELLAISPIMTNITAKVESSYL